MRATWLEISTRSVIHLLTNCCTMTIRLIIQWRLPSLCLMNSIILKIIPCPDVQGKKRFSSILNCGFDTSRNEWVMHWAPDFVAYSEGEHAIQKLFEKAVEQDKWDAIVFKAPNVAGDIFHSFPSERQLLSFRVPEPYLWRKGHFRIEPGEHFSGHQ